MVEISLLDLERIDIRSLIPFISKIYVDVIVYLMNRMLSKEKATDRLL
jgi:hypothetical protein